MSTPELHWSKSSYSDSNEPGDCVEVATEPVAVHVRDSKRPETSRLAVAPASWTEFVAYVAE
ncbi:DUF397 domain-containing protein [Streptomyces sp. NPDC058319]|uniref:DUF397 domain-containing protein n=1 Tax=unclassified Streptomyces TaxID=2593676 RepID=UPI0036EFA5F1